MLRALRTGRGGTGYSAVSSYGGDSPRASSEIVKKPNPLTRQQTGEASHSASELSHLSLPQ